MRSSSFSALAVPFALAVTAPHARAVGEWEEQASPASPAPAAPAEQPEVESPFLKSLTTLVESEAVTVEWGGRLMIDFGWFDADDDYGGVGEGEPAPDAGFDPDGFEIRRARFFAKGTFYENVESKVQVDFAGGDVSVKDMYVKYKTPHPAVTAGHFFEPMGLEQLTSSRFITFMERAMAIEAFAPERNVGIMASDHLGDSSTWALGVFRWTDGGGSDRGDGEYALTGRLTHAFLGDEPDDVVHLGVSASNRAGVPDERFRTRPEAHLVERVFDSGSMPSDGTLLYGLEAAWVSGPISLQGEYLMASVDEFGGSGSPDVDFGSWYAFVSYFLTGEHRSYDPKKGVFGRVKPHENWGGGDLDGAWEVALRYSSADFDDGPFDTQVDNITLGLNWYLNPYARIMWNLVQSNFESGGLDEDFTALMMRLQVDW